MPQVGPRVLVFARTSSPVLARARSLETVGFEVYAASVIDDALDVLAQVTIHALVVDVDGMGAAATDLVREARTLDPQIRTIAIESSDEREHPQRRIQTDELLVGTFTPERLASTIDAVRAAPARTTPAEADERDASIAEPRRRYEERIAALEQELADVRELLRQATTDPQTGYPSGEG